MRNCPPRCEQPTQIHLLPPRPDATLCSNSINSARSDTEDTASEGTSIVAAIFSARSTSCAPAVVRWMCWARRSRVLRTRSTQPRSTMRSSVTAMLGAEMSSAWPSCFWFTWGVLHHQHQHQDRELDDLQVERLHVPREDFAQRDCRAARRVADKMRHARGVGLGRGGGLRGRHFARAAPR